MVTSLDKIFDGNLSQEISIEYHFYCEACNANHSPFELFLCTELYLHHFLATTYSIRSLILHTTYRPK